MGCLEVITQFKEGREQEIGFKEMKGRRVGSQGGTEGEEE